MILGFQEDEIVKLAVENQNENFDGVVQYDYETGELYGCSMSQGETENPNNQVIEVFRLKQGEMGVIEYDCDDCPYNDEEAHRKCCMEAYIDNYFDEDFEDNFKEPLEKQIKEVIENHVDELLDVYARIRFKILDILRPEDYYNLINDDYKMRVIDNFVDMAYESGFSLKTTAEDYLFDEHLHLIQLTDDSENEKIQKINRLLNDEKFNEIMEMD